MNSLLQRRAFIYRNNEAILLILLTKYSRSIGTFQSFQPAERDLTIDFQANINCSFHILYVYKIYFISTAIYKHCTSSIFILIKNTRILTSQYSS